MKPGFASVVTVQRIEDMPSFLAADDCVAVLKPDALSQGSVDYLARLGQSGLAALVQSGAFPHEGNRHYLGQIRIDGNGEMDVRGLYGLDRALPDLPGRGTIITDLVSHSYAFHDMGGDRIVHGDLQIVAPAAESGLHIDPEVDIRAILQMSGEGCHIVTGDMLALPYEEVPVPSNPDVQFRYYGQVGSLADREVVSPLFSLMAMKGGQHKICAVHGEPNTNLGGSDQFRLQMIWNYVPVF